MHWQIVPTPQGCQLLVDGRPIGSSAEPPPSGWLQRMFGLAMPLAYEVARRQCRGYVGSPVGVIDSRGVLRWQPGGQRARVQPSAQRCYMVSYVEGSHAGGEEIWEEISCAEHGLPPGTCMNNLGCIPMPMDCMTREPFDLPMECPEGWLALHKSDCCGEVVGCIPPDQECEKVWTYEAEECPPGYQQDGWHWAEDGEDLARVCCRAGVPHPNWTGRPGIDPVMYEPFAAGARTSQSQTSWLWHCIDKCFDYCGWKFGGTGGVAQCQKACGRMCGGLLAPSRPRPKVSPKALAVAGAARRCRTTYDDGPGLRGVKRTHCDDGTVTLDLYKLNEQLDREGWATYEIPIAGGRCPKREDYLPYCDPCTQPMCGCTIPPDCPPMDCSGPPSTPIDPHARVRAFRRGYETQRAWQEAGGEGIVPEWFVEQMESA